MANLIELQLSNGKSIFAEVEETEDSQKGHELSGGTRNIGQVSFDLIATALAGIAEDVEGKLSDLQEKRPKKVVVEISANVTASGSIFITSGKVQGGIKLQMTWEK